MANPLSVTVFDYNIDKKRSKELIEIVEANFVAEDAIPVAAAKGQGTTNGGSCKSTSSLGLGSDQV